MPTVAKQLELNLWDELKTAISEPELADLEHLWQVLEQAISKVDKGQQLQVAGEAIVQIVKVYVGRANSILDDLEVSDSSDGPVLAEDFLVGLMRQSMTIDLSELMEEVLTVEEDSPTEVTTSSEGSQVLPIDKKTARAIAYQAQKKAQQQLQDLAEQEQVSLWQQVISLWMQRHNGKAVSLLQLQRALEMPLIEIWLGLLLGEQEQYKWETSGEFYNDAGKLWLSEFRVRGQELGVKG